MYFQTNFQHINLEKSKFKKSKSKADFLDIIIIENIKMTH